ncbi:retrotransposon protein, putative, ty3-gypsy subclass [Tanacetum coccineum]
MGLGEAGIQIKKLHRCVVGTVACVVVSFELFGKGDGMCIVRMRGRVGVLGRAVGFVVVNGITMYLAKVEAITKWPIPMMVAENKEREKSFEELKRRLVSTPVLTLPSGTGGYQIYSDASQKGLGCVLMQHRKALVGTSEGLRHKYLVSPSKANVVANALSRKNSGTRLKIEPNLILRIKETQKEDDELWNALENLKEGKHVEF